VLKTAFVTFVIVSSLNFLSFELLYLPLESSISHSYSVISQEIVHSIRDLLMYLIEIHIVVGLINPWIVVETM